MADDRNRKRPIQVKFFVDENELGTIRQLEVWRDFAAGVPLCARLPFSRRRRSLPAF